MFSLILAILVINNYSNNIKISKDFYNFAIVCLIFDIIFVLYEFYSKRFNYFKMLINIIAITEASLIINSGIGSNFTEVSFGIAATIVVLESLKIYLEQRHSYLQNSKVHPY